MSFSHLFRLFFALSLSCLVHVVVIGQKYVVKNSSNGFQDDYVYDAVQDSMGHMWFATGSGLIKLDNQKSQLLKLKAKDAETLLYSLTISNETLWMAGKNGLMAKYNSNFIEPITSPFKQRVVGVLPLGSNHVAFISQDEGVYLYNTQKNTGVLLTNEALSLQKTSSAKIIHKTLHICTKNGISSFKLKNNTLIPTSSLKISYPNDLTLISKNTVLIGTNRNELFKASINELGEIQQIGQPLTAQLGIESQVKSIDVDKKGSIWVSTHGQGLFNFVLKPNTNEVQDLLIYNEKNGLGTNFINKSYQDYEGNIWICTYGNGVLLKQSNYISQLTDPIKTNVSVSAIQSIGDKLFFSSQNTIYELDQTGKFLELHTFLQDKSLTKITKMITLNSTELLIAFDGYGLIKFNYLTKKITPIKYSQETLSNKINDVIVQGENLWVATFNGLYHLSANGQIIQHYSSEYGLRHNVVITIAQKPNGEIVAGSKSNRLFIASTHGFREIKLPGIQPNIDVSAIHIKGDDDLWIGTLGSGLFHIERDTITNLHKANGLPSNYVYDLASLKNGDLIISHQNKLTKIELGTLHIETLGSNFTANTDFIPNSAFQHQDKLYFGLHNGLISFDELSYLDQYFEPKIGFIKLSINDVNYPNFHHQTIRLNYDKHKIVVDFKGVSFSNSTNIKYSYFLEGFDDEWHDGNFVDQAVYKNVGPGQYTFKIKACIKDKCIEKTSNFVLIIDLPLWEKLWFILLCTFGLMVGILFIFYMQDQSNKRKKRDLEYNIMIKTRQLADKTKVLENQNHNIISSITYAKRIQDAIMPDNNNIKHKNFDFFTVEMPKDIVGGDFIWHDTIEGKLIVAVCDCTGHGVPGGFMTVLGASLLNSIVLEKRIFDPAQILTKLNDEVLKQLHAKNANETQLKDGMDMNIVVIDHTQNSISFCNAKRPAILLRKSGQLRMLRKINKSIGEADTKADFGTTSFPLDEVKGFYFFTDGYVDQFGGPDEKKLTRTGLIDLLEQIKDMSCQEQNSILNQTIIDWKSTFDFQLDDITLLGAVPKPQEG